MRKNDVKIESTFDSVLSNLDILVKQMDDFRKKAIRDYNEVKHHSNDIADRIQLEQIRSNAFKSFEQFFKMRLDAIKIHAMVVGKLSVDQNKRYEDKFDQQDKDELLDYVENLKNEMRDKQKGK